MSRQYTNRSFVPPRRPSDSSSWRLTDSSQFQQPQTQNDFSYFQYPPHRQTGNTNNNNPHSLYHSNEQEEHHQPRSSLPFSRITAAATSSASAPHYHFENPSAASFTRHPPWFDNDWEDNNDTNQRSSHHNNHTKRQRSSVISPPTSQSYHQHERKRSRHDGNERTNHRQPENLSQPQQQYRSSSHHPYQPYPIHRPVQPTPPTSHNIPFDYGLHNRPVQPVPHHQPFFESPPPPPPPPPPPVASLHRSFNTHHHHHHHRSGMTFEPTSQPPPLFHQTSMTTHMHQRPSPPSFLLTDLLHRVIDAHAASYSDNHAHYRHPSIDLIAYAWMSPSHEIFSLPAAFSIQFGDFFDLILPNETPVVGLTDSELERLPTLIYTKTCTNIPVDDKCAVCLSEYVNGEKLKRLRCKHYFHSECIDPWLKTSTRCPICRGEQTS